MKRTSAKRAWALVLAFFLVSGEAFTQIPRSAQGVDLSGLVTFTRPVDKSYPVTATAQVFVSNEYGAIRILAWDQQVVRVTARILVGAENAIQAERFAQAIQVSGNHIGDRLEVRTLNPKVPEGSSIGYTTDLEISLPRSAKVTLENTFGDILVRGIGGEVLLDARYCPIEIRDITGPIRVRAKGGFPLTAERLGQGGTFFLRSTQATFSQVSGPLHVSNYLGSVEIRSPGQTVEMDITSESGPIHLYLPADAEPDLEASADFGQIESDVLLDSETWGESTHGRSSHPEATQRIDLHASFDSVYIHRQGAFPAAGPHGGGKPIKQVRQQTHRLGPDTEIVIDATIGDIKVTGTEGDRIELTATRFIRITNMDNARMALEGLALRVQNTPERFHIATVLQDDMEALGCTEYRVDLEIRCPQRAAVKIVAREGRTAIAKLLGTVTVEQQKGRVRIESVQGDADITNREGNIDTVETSGTLTVHAVSGAVTVRNALGPVHIMCDRGQTVVESPRAGVTVRNTGGDVRLIALEGIQGEYDVLAENGNISLAIPDTAEAWLIVNVHGGTVRSSEPLSGTTEGDVQSFQRRMNDGTYRVLLETHQGNVVID